MSITDELLVCINKWNNELYGEFTNLLLADNFSPKPISSKMPVEMVFWYDITNLYSLLYDCMPFFFRVSKFYFRSNIKFSSRNRTNIKSIIDILNGLNIISLDEKKNIINFTRAVNELRGCFCHNKKVIYFNTERINISFGECQDWAVFPHLQNMRKARFDYRFDYHKAYKIISAKCHEMMTIIGKAIDKFIIIGSLPDREEWANSIAAWYLSSEELAYRELRAYYSRKDNNKRLGDWIHSGLKKMSQVSGYSDADRLTFVEKRLDFVKDAILYSHPATPDKILPMFFKKYID
ncbi:MAG: hypothetical protein LBF78_12255 [Treponema sp.]|jgi:hypothetical protein|nr:hypothetical protein [Treponema sp.]